MEKKAIILFHGYVTDVNDFGPLVPFLKEIYECVALYNFPGHGEGSNLDDFNCVDTIKFADKLVNEVFEKYDVVDLVGFSMGGAIASYLSTVYNFHKVVLLAPANKFINLGLGLSRIKIELEYLKTLLSPKKASVDKEIINIRHELTINDKKSMHIAFKQLIPNYTARTIKSFMQVVDYCNFYLNKGRITEPILILWGDVDQLVPYSSIKFVNKYCDNCTVEKLMGISHLMLYSDNNQIIIDRILEFLK